MTEKVTMLLGPRLLATVLEIAIGLAWKVVIEGDSIRLLKAYCSVAVESYHNSAARLQQLP